MAVAVLSYDRFSYDYPEVDVTVTASGFASLTDGGRYRFERDAQLKRYDSRPATEGAERNDHSVTFALGWSF